MCLAGITEEVWHVASSMMHQQCTILHIEDEDTDAVLFERALKKLGFAGSYVRSRSFEAAQRMVAPVTGSTTANSPLVPSLIVADSHLGFHNALEVVEWVKAHRDLAAVPVVVYGGIMPEEYAAELRGAGAALCLQKPINTPEAIPLVKQMLECATGC